VAEAARARARRPPGDGTRPPRRAVDRIVAGYGTDVDLDVIRAWWSLRSLRAVRWLVEHGFDPWPEVAVLRSRL
jgi:hypothetical protein